MDVYSGIYLESDDSDFVSVSPDDERLLVVQLRVDPIEICFDSDHRVGDCPIPAQEVCSRCSADLHTGQAFSFSEKDLQLKLAITWYPSKKKIPAALDQEPQEVLETLSRLEPSSPLKGQPEDEEGKEDSGVRIDQDRNEQPSDTKIEESSPAAENDPIQDRSSPNDNGTEAKVDIDDDDSQDSEEDRDLIAWADNDGAQEDDDSRHNGVELTELSPGGYTALHIACESASRLDILRFLLQKGADLNHLLLNNAEDKENHADLHHIAKDGESPLHKLLSRTNIPLDLLRAFFARGADVNMEDQDSERPLYEAAVYGETEAIKEIIEGVSDVDDDNNLGRTALHAAALGGYLDTVKVLLDYGADIERKDHHGRTPLSFACWGSVARLPASEATAEYLLDVMLQKGLKFEQINAITKRSRKPSRAAAAHGFSNVVESLLKMMDSNDKDSINRRDILKGRSPLHCAALHGLAEMVALLLSHGADATLRDGVEEDGKTALELCHAKWALLESPEYESTVAHLIDAVPGEAAAHPALLATAAEYGSVPILEKLFNARADFSKPDRYGWTPLILARQYRRDEAVTFLSKRVASIGLQPTRWTYTYGDDSTNL
ncbi:MAG: hypothetical protein Q9228_006868 [Teloschistes exilis]